MEAGLTAQRAKNPVYGVTLWSPRLESHKRRVTACFTALDASGRVAGYYTLALASILLTDLAENLARKLPRYANVPAARMGRLPVNQDLKGKGLGAALLADVLRRAVTAEMLPTRLWLMPRMKTLPGSMRTTGSVPLRATHFFMPSTGNCQRPGQVIVTMSAQP